jgi:quinol-cytochrome oxidoreductase complex cytochrome b subunit
VSRWTDRFGRDLRASTDANLLVVLRFLGLLYGPIDRRLPIDEAFRKALRYRLPAHVGWRHALGGITYLLFMVLVVTGVLLSLYYRPSTEEAYGSIQRIVTDVPMGWLIRDLHVWSASLIVLAVLAHMARVFFEGAYKPPRETSWLIGLVLLFVVVGFGATGYLLPWDQWAYWTVTVVLNTMEGVPLIGGFTARVLTGDVVVTGATLSRFFALHAIILPWVAFALLMTHHRMVRIHGPARPRGSTEPPEPGRRFFPDHFLRLFIVAVLVLATVISLATLYPRPMGEQAMPDVPPPELVSTWVVTDVSLALIRFFGPWGLTLYTLLALVMLVLPLFDRRPQRRLRRRLILTALGIVYFVGFLVFWVVGHQVRFVPEDPSRASPEEIPAPAEPGEPVPEIGPEPVGPSPEGGETAEGGGSQ